MAAAARGVIIKLLAFVVDLRTSFRVRTGETRAITQLASIDAYLALSRRASMLARQISMLLRQFYQGLQQGKTSFAFSEGNAARQSFLGRTVGSKQDDDGALAR